VVVRVAGFAAMIVLLLCSAALFGAVQGRRSALDAAEAETRRTAQLMEAHAERTFEAIEMLARAIDAWLQEPGIDVRARPLDEVDRLLKAISSAEIGVRLFDASGRMMPFAGLGMADIEIGDRPHFHAAMTRDPPPIVIGAPVITRDTQRHVIPALVRVGPNPYGVALVGLGVGVQTFVDLYGTVRSGPSGFVGLYHRDGLQLARNPFRPELIGRSFANAAGFPRGPDAPKALTSYLVTPTDGIERVLSFRRVEGLPLVVAAAMSVDDALADWRRQAQGVAGLVLMASSVVVAFAAWVIWLLRRRESETLRLALALEAATAAGRAKNDFLAKMSHELRTPLNAILGFSDLIGAALAGPLPARYRDYAQDIHRSAEHLLSLINDVLDISRLESGRLDLRDEEVDLAELAAEVVALLRLRAEERAVTIGLDLPDDLPRLTADRRAVLQMLLNLSSNALKFAPAGTSITLAAAHHADGVIVEVSDRGPGIGADKAAMVTEPFGRGSSFIARAGEGIGLGLPITKALIERHDGRLEIHSPPEGGTQVRLLFPTARIVARSANGAPGG
jgi:signal transduction histidine kinase